MRLLTVTAAAAGLMLMIGLTASFAAGTTPMPSTQAQPQSGDQAAATVTDLQERLGRDEHLLQWMQGELPKAPATAAEPSCRSNGYDAARGECN